MSTSTLTLYKNCLIVPERNFVVEDIEAYLGTFNAADKVIISDFQYLRPTLELTIKINKNQDTIGFLQSNNFNYLKIAQSSRNYYYFIINKEWRAEETIALTLRMDVINTFSWNTTNGFNVSQLTKVLREHKDRFEESTETYSTIVPMAFDNFEVNGIYSSLIEQETDPYFGRAQIVFDMWPADYWHALSIEEVAEYAQYNLMFPVEIEDLTAEETLIEGTDFVIDSHDPVLGIFEVNELPILDGRIILLDPTRAGHQFNVIVTIEYTFYTYKRLIDLYSEGFNPVLYKKELGTLYDKNDLSQDWYLMYQNANDQENSPVDVYLIPSNKVNVKVVGGIEVSSNTEAFDDNNWIEFSYYWNDFNYNLTFTLDNGGSVSTGYRIETSSQTQNGMTIVAEWEVFTDIIVWNEAPDLYVRLVEKYHKRGTNYSNPNNWADSKVIGEYTPETLTCAAPRLSIQAICGTDENNPKYVPWTGDVWTFTSSSNVTLNTIENVDRTLSTIMKIFALPYFPYTMELDSGKLIIPSNWSYDSETGFLKFSGKNLDFMSQINTDFTNPLFEKLYIKDMDINVNGNRYHLDPKLYHSDFYRLKFVYDSFNFTYALEKMKVEDISVIPMFSFKFKMTSTIRSRFLFSFEWYKLSYSTEDYDYILSVERNNESMLLNSAYLTYLRTGYNIDVKAKNRTAEQGMWNVLFGGIGGALGVAGAQSNVGLKAIGAGAGILSSIVSQTYAVQAQEEGIERKIASAKAQAISVDGADDLDLLEYYSDNKAKLVEYSVSPRMKKLLDDLFYYCGYISDEMKIPTINTRYWFNYLQCELVLTGVNGNIPEICVEEIKKKYKEGVTFLHKHNNVWNFAQDKENWEVSLIGD